MEIDTSRAHALDAGSDVWCTTFDQEARTALGCCQYCGATDHPAEPPAREVAPRPPAVRRGRAVVATVDEAHEMFRPPTRYGPYRDAATWTRASLGEVRDV